MTRARRLIPVMIIVLGIISVVIGFVFVGQSVAKKNLVTQQMLSENVKLALSQGAEPTLIADAATAQAAADLIREHRRNIAPTYQDLLAGKGYDPTNPDHLRYAQALNMGNYLYLGVLAFGLTDVVLGSGVIMILTGVALGGTGVALRGLLKEKSA
ncbi:MAG: hypothetical protein FJ025_02400 [Chloroflexi bacterium]|nr:hypothetical protein [Chloroflexota bacterium]